jgi:hypothetical protein
MFALCFMSVSCSGYQPFQPWNTREVVTEIGYLGSSYIDYTQTLKVTEEGRELNPQLGEHPSKYEIAQYFITTRILHWAVADFLEPDDRMFWLTFWFGASTTTIFWNWRQGF